MQSQNEFDLHPNSLFARNLNWTKGVTLNPCKRIGPPPGPGSIQTETKMTILGLTNFFTVIEPT